MTPSEEEGQTSPRRISIPRAAFWEVQTVLVLPKSRAFPVFRLLWLLWARVLSPKVPCLLIIRYDQHKSRE